MTAKAEISRLLAIFNTLSENDKDLVLKVSEAIKTPKIISATPGQAKNCSGEQHCVAV
jgi:fructose/tagatose bisphosphate aldolase